MAFDPGQNGAFGRISPARVMGTSALTIWRHLNKHCEFSPPKR